MKDSFRHLINDLCKAAGLADPKRVEQGESIQVDGVECAILHHDELAPDLAFAYVAFGAAPARDQARIYEMLLQQNYLGFAGKGPCFTISPISGHVVYVEHARIDQTSGRELLARLGHLAARAVEWRLNHFLEEAAPARADAITAGHLAV